MRNSGQFKPGQTVGASNVNWRGDAVSEQGGRQRARRMYPGLRDCEIRGCGGKAERHHKDGNTRNNAPQNIAFLCNKHHKEADGRMSRPEFRASQIGKKLSAEHRAKIGASLVGRPCSDATRQKLSRSASAHASKNKPSHCPQGHPYDAENTYINKIGAMNCRACSRARSLRRYHSQKGAA